MNRVAMDEGVEAGEDLAASSPAQPGKNKKVKGEGTVKVPRMTAKRNRKEQAEAFALDIKKAYFVVGKAGYGKTTFVREYIVEIPASELWVFDFNKYDYAMLRNTEAKLWENQTGTPEEAQEFIEAAYSKKDDMYDPKCVPHQGWTFVVLEEADNYLPKKLPGITRFVNTARNRAIGFLASAKRAKSVPPLYRTRFDFIVVFHTTLPEDIEYIGEWIGIYEDKEQMSMLDKLLRGLGKGEYIICDTNSGDVLGPYKLKLRLPDHNVVDNMKKAGKPEGMSVKEAVSQ